MKNRAFPNPLLAIAGVTVLALSAMPVSAQNSSISTNAPVVADTAATHQASPAQLPYGASDVLQLTRAGVGDDTIAAFVGNSGNLYNLRPSEIVYLREQGVSEHVITTMLNQRQPMMATTTQIAPQDQAYFAAPPPNYPDANSAQYTPAYVQPTVIYVEAAPVYVPTSTVYVIPYPTRYINSGYQPSFGGFHGYSSVSVVTIGNNHGGGFRGSGSFNRGGGFRGGGGSFHGGGGSHSGGSRGGGHH